MKTILKDISEHYCSEHKYTMKIENSDSSAFHWKIIYQIMTLTPCFTSSQLAQLTPTKWIAYDLKLHQQSDLLDLYNFFEKLFIQDHDNAAKTIEILETFCKNPYLLYMEFSFDYQCSTLQEMANLSLA